jgi:hypothetical protein
LGVLVFTATPPALAYSCGTGNSSQGHCYAIEWWQTSISNPPPYRGAYLDIETVPIISGNFSGSFLDTEMWVPLSLVGGNGGYWIETGTITWSWAAQRYFWADYRPSGWAIHYFTNVPSGDYGNYAYYQIEQTCSTCNSYQISLYSPSNYWYYGTSTNDPTIDFGYYMGSELAGTGTGSYMQYPAIFTDRGYFDTNFYSHSIGDHENYTPYNVPTDPPYQTVDNYPQTGDFNTYCC